MAIQNRRGDYSDFDPSRMVPGEYAVVLSNDPDGADGCAVYLCFASGVVQRFVSADELQGVLDAFTIEWSNVTDTPSSYPTTWNDVSNKPAIRAGTGSSSITEGYVANVASGTYAHAEGEATTASGAAAHAEGGPQTKASGSYSHAEGLATEAYGQASHAEGYGTYAVGQRSHAEGSNTTAQGNDQHVFGKYNSVPQNYSDFVEIVGNGTTSNNSNARTLDWSGNEVLAGKLTVGAAPTADMDVATKQYVDEHVTFTDPNNDGNIVISFS